MIITLTSLRKFPTFSFIQRSIGLRRMSTTSKVKLDNSQSILVCKQENYDYFKEYCKKKLPSDLVPLIIPQSQVLDYDYADEGMQKYYTPLREFFIDSKNNTVLHDCCENMLISPEITSTQTILEDYYSKAKHNVMYFARRMTKGKGRANNTWESQEGGLMFSFTSKSRTTENVYLPYIISLCLIRAIKPFIPEAMIKWPNDLYISGKKVCGILCTSNPDDHFIVNGKSY